MPVASGSEISMGVSDSRDLYADPYDWANLQAAGQARSYVEDGQTRSRLGVDVSEHQGDIDWQQFASQGVQFAYIRIGYRSTDKGAIAKDARYDENLQGARDAGMKIGVYFYSMATSEDEAREEADFVCDTLGDTALDYPVTFDMEPSQSGEGETRIDDLSPSQMTAIAQAFCERVQERGHRAIIYGNQFDLNHFDLDKLKQFGFWYAEYESQPSSPLSFGIWQYTNSATLEGCDEKVDLDLDLTDVLADKLEQRSDGRSAE